MVYNKDLLAKAEIDPATLTHFEAYQSAFEKLDRMKKDLGIEAVVSMASSPAAGMAWLTGQQLFNVYLAGGLPYDDPTVINQTLAGTVDPDRLAQYAEYINLINRFADPEILLHGNYRAQLEAFAAGKTAFLPQGNWADPTLTELGADFERAFAPHGPFLEPTEGIFVAPPAWYCVNQESEGAAQARAFLAAIATTQAGHRYMIEDAQMVPAFKSTQLQPALPLSRNVQEWANAGKTYSWQQRRLPAGFGSRELGPIFEQLAAGHISPTEFASRVTAAVAATE
jgi:raffinose/stachyose/melibiose transport system substrate-binding protein